MSALDATPVVVTPPLLREQPLPDHGSASDKGERGQVLVVGGSGETPGGVLLAGLAALRVGAGKLQLATAEEAAPALSVAVPESRVVPLPTDADGSIRPGPAVDALGPLLEQAAAVLVGTSTLQAGPAGDLLAGLVPALGPETAVVVDAGALPVLSDRPQLLAPVADRAVVVPNPAEAARLLDTGIDVIGKDPAAALVELVDRLGCVVAVRAPDTWIAGPGTEHHLDRSGHPALGTSGSGDVLAGALTGLLARGADPLSATLWAVHLHGRAGEQAAARVGGLGILARELLDELPRALAAVAARPA